MKLRDQIRSKTEKKLSSVYRAAISGENLFPWAVPLNRSNLKDDLILWREEAEDLRRIDKNHTGSSGPVVQYKTVNTRKFGNQSFPDRVVFESQEDLLGYLGKTREFERLKKLIERSRSIPEIESWLRRPSAPAKLLANESIWDGVLEVSRYFMTRADFDLYPRLFPLTVHSKFLEENRTLLSEILAAILPDDRKNTSGASFEEKFLIKTGAQRISFRIPDEVLRSKLGIPFSELEAPTKEVSAVIESCKEPLRFIIIENKANYLTFPKVLGAVIIFGSGFLVGSLERYRFLDRGRVIYWGDIDAHGLEILSLVREQFPHTETFLMSEGVLASYWTGTKGNPSERNEDPTSLSPAELKLYRLIKSGEKRLEQERIPSQAVSEALRQLNLV